MRILKGKEQRKVILYMTASNGYPRPQFIKFCGALLNVYSSVVTRAFNNTYYEYLDLRLLVFSGAIMMSVMLIFNETNFVLILILKWSLAIILGGYDFRKNFDIIVIYNYSVTMSVSNSNINEKLTNFEWYFYVANGFVGTVMNVVSISNDLYYLSKLTDT